MKTITLLLITILFFSCGTPSDEVVISKEEYSPKNRFNNTYMIVVIDGCEYIYMETRFYDGGIALSHKGNCKNHGTK